MRAIVAREGRHARDERREAQAAYVEAHKPQDSTVGWSTKAPPRKKASPAERAIADQIADSSASYRKRHPQRAAAERTLRKQRARILDDWNHKAHGTPETHEHHKNHHAGTLKALYDTGSIDAEQLASAVQIADVAERICRDVAIGTASLETRVDVTRSPDQGFFEKLGAVRLEVAYGEWRDQVRGPIAAVLDMIIGQPIGYTVAAKRYGMGARRAKKLLIDALDLWPHVLGRVAKDLDAATLAAAHAGILA